MQHDNVPKKRRKWTTDEDDLIRELGGTMSDREISERLGRSLRSVQHRRSRINVAGRNLSAWSEEDDEAIRVAIERGGYASHLAKSRGRTGQAWSRRARALGLSFRDGRQKHRYPFVYRGRRFVAYDKTKRRYVAEHETVMEERLGRPIARGEIVHHVDHDKLNNGQDNLYLCASRAEHRQLHMSFDHLVPELMRRGIVEFDQAKGAYILCVATEGQP